LPPTNKSLSIIKENVMNKTISTVSLQMATLAMIISPFLIPPATAHSMTADEFVKLFGVVDRYIQDINRTFPSNPQPLPEPVEPTLPENPSSEPTDPQPF
jgi:hypothetical protein